MLLSHLDSSTTECGKNRHLINAVARGSTSFLPKIRLIYVGFAEMNSSSAQRSISVATCSRP
jgi:hypothetical protein